MRNGMTHRQGINLVIEESSRIPNIVSEHIPLYPHSSTHVAITEKNIFRLTEPYPSKCTNTYPEKYKNMTTNGAFEYAYSEKTCQSMCRSYFVHEYCGCYKPAILEGSLGWTQFSNSKFCEYNFTITDSCFVEAINLVLDSNEKVCECFPECYSPKYQVYLNILLPPFLI